MRSLLACSVLVLLASGSFAQGGKPTIDDLQKEFERRVLSEVEAQGDNVPPDELHMLAGRLAKEVFGKHPDVLRAEAEKALKELPGIETKELEGHEVKYGIDVFGELLKEGYVTDDFLLVRGWRPERVAHLVAQIARARLWGAEQYGRRALLMQLVPDKVFSLQGQERTTLAIRSLRDYVLVEVQLAESGVFRPVSLRWLVPKTPEQGAPAEADKPRPRAFR